MERMNHSDQHRAFPPGTIVIAADGEQLGSIRVVHEHYLLVSQDNNPHADLEVPPHAIASFDGKRLHLTVNRRALSVVDVEETAGHQLRTDEG